ncbi:hypothetical protein A2U01_0047585, partial [Trifolium medium]|nr:hypothetical protein [Trifolium medium]
MNHVNQLDTVSNRYFEFKENRLKRRWKEPPSTRTHCWNQFK